MSLASDGEEAQQPSNVGTLSLLSLIPEEASEPNALGPFFAAEDPHFGPHTIDSALSSTPRKSNVLLPVHLRVSSSSSSEQTRRHRQEGHRVQDLDFKALQSSYIESLSMAIRSQLITQKWSSDYGIMLPYPLNPKVGHSSPIS